MICTRRIIVFTLQENRVSRKSYHISKSKTLPVSKSIYALFKVITWCLHSLSDISSPVAVPQMARSRNSFRAYICASSVDKHFSFSEFLLVLSLPNTTVGAGSPNGGLIQTHKSYSSQPDQSLCIWLQQRENDC